MGWQMSYVGSEHPMKNTGEHFLAITLSAIFMIGDGEKYIC